MVQCKSWIREHPRLSGVILGAFLVLVTNAMNLGISSRYVDKITHENERLSQIHYEYVQSSSERIDSLRNENSRLKSRATTYRLVLPDGTIEERTSTEVESEESLSESVRSEFETRVLEKLEEQKSEWSRQISESKKLTLGLGITPDLRYYGIGSYRAFPPFTINGLLMNDGTIGAGIGITF